MNTFDEIIQTKAYNDLNSSELEVIQELVSSEEEYNEMKSFYAGIDQLTLSNREEVSPSVKTSLNAVFQAKHPGISQNWNAPAELAEKKIIPLYNRNLFRVAALLVLSAGVTTVWISMSEDQLAKSEQVQLTASSDSISHEEQKEAEPKKKFPLNEGNEKEFTAASSVPADENVDQTSSVYSNATSTNYSVFKNTAASTDKIISPSAGSGIFLRNDATVNGATYSFSNSKPNKQSNWAEKEKKEEANYGNLGAFAKAGLNADLNPGGVPPESAKDYKPSITTTDMLSLIEPSF